MTEDQIKTLAKFFTGTAVIAYSVGLEMKKGGLYEVAVEFFAARRALGIEGYISAEEAEKILRA